MGVSRILAAFASLGAAAIHFASAPDHYAEWWAAGVFFYAVGAFQAGWALAALRARGTAALLLGLAAHAAVIATWVVSRTAGMPIGPGAGMPEDITRAGITATAFEAVVCLALLALLRRRSPRGFVSSLRAVVLAGVAGALVTGLTMPAVEVALSHSHGGAEDGTSHHREEDGGDTGPHEGGPGTSPEDTPATRPNETTTPGEEGSSAPDPAEEPDGHGHDDEPHGH
ncbi:hypothetical protein [Streptomyces xinghaiensis]|uniref:hypothetical protein n=1 Tax=Streptomyces xinghaiensis TaxID=1038928 RepID=UPI00341899B3